jgi:hypothetical protein
MAVCKAWMRLPEAGWRLPENPGGLHPADEGSGRKMTPPKGRMGFHEAGWRLGKAGNAFRALKTGRERKKAVGITKNGHPKEISRPGSEKNRPGGQRGRPEGEKAGREQKKAEGNARRRKGKMGGPEDV